ncbi:helix-turn-helix domain-containing protein [Castellaniella sp. MT123]|uniref:helix-turn-helix domain-containing protein n=1 Tax=Castellaniella sp. MT123 TaxID=3140381 RepID=UPI0031F39C4A
MPPLVALSFSVEPFMSVVQRHVKLSKKARDAITHDLAEVLGHTNVQLITDKGTVDHHLTPAVGEADSVLTTEEAAQLVNVSRPYMVKLIDTGVIALHQKVGNQRRVLRSVVLQWQSKERARQAQALKSLSEGLSEEIFAS